MSTLAVGATLQSGKYEIIKVLGQGGFGVTYLARHVLLGELFAIKEFFPKDYCNREEEATTISVATKSNTDLVNRLRLRFVTEARNVRKLDHPGIVKIHDIFEENGTAYYVMDLVEGTPLSELAEAPHPLPEQRAVEYTRSLCGALRYMHSCHITHFDIKPANVIVRKKDNRPVLIDFGLSKQYSDDGTSNSTMLVAISRGYSPPEQYMQESAKQFSPQSDIYALGATLLYMLTGETPPESVGLSDGSISVPDSVSTPTAKAIRYAMTPARDKRCPDAATLLNALLASDEPHQDSPKPAQHEPSKHNDDPSRTIIQNVTPKAKSNKNRKWLIGIGAVVLAGVAIVSLTPSGTQSSPEPTPTPPVKDSILSPVMLTDYVWDSPLGESLYTGEALIEGHDTIPNDSTAVLRMTAGEFKGAEYRGTILRGTLTGKCTYTAPNGDIYTGTFKNNEYDQGSYKIISTGETFTGTFTNGQPDKGTWEKP